MLVESAEANQTQVRRILQSKAFRTSEVQRNLLNYLSEKSLAGEADTVKEYTVGLDVFGKPASYDPRQESVVRMHMARLRQKLNEYYRVEGAEDSIIVDLPKGAFRVTFEPRPTAQAPPQVIHALPALPPPSYKIEIVLAVLLIAALAIATYFGLQLRSARKSPGVVASDPQWTQELQDLWAPMLAADRPLVVVLETQDTSNMTGLSAANGAFLLGQFLANRKQNVYVMGSGDLSMPDIVMGNLVVLGPAAARNRQLQALPIREELILEAGGIRNLHPGQNEPAFLPNPPARGPQSTVDESYALITHSPGVNGKGDVLYLSGNHTSSPTAGVEAFTDPSLARMIAGKLRKGDGSLPYYYQIVLSVRSMEDTPIEITYVMHKELTAR